MTIIPKKTTKGSWELETCEYSSYWEAVKLIIPMIINTNTGYLKETQLFGGNYGFCKVRDRSMPGQLEFFKR